MINAGKGLIGIALLASSQVSHAAFFYYFGADNPDDGSPNTSISVSDAQTAWETAVTGSSLGLSVVNFETNYTNVSTATGLGAQFSATSQNVNLSNPDDVFRGTADNAALNTPPTEYGVAEFSALGGLGTPGFTIEATETIDISGDNFSGQRRSGVFYNDAPQGKDANTVAGWVDVLSIGKFNGFDGPGDPFNAPPEDFDNDDFDLEITGGDVLYAFAFKLINNNKSGTEFLDVFSSRGGTQLAHIGDDSNDGTAGIGASSLIPGYNGGEGNIGGVDFVHTSFIGIVTDSLAEAFSFLQFNEDSSVNDIGIFDLQFGVLNTAPVPVPAAVWLFGSGVLFLIGLRRKNPITH